MALNNENNPLLVSIHLGSPDADALLPALYLLKAGKLLGAWLINGADLAASDTDYVQLELKSGSTILAELDTRAAHENGLSEDVAKALNLVAAEVDRAAGETLTVNYNETDSGTSVALTDAKLVLSIANK